MSTPEEHLTAAANWLALAEEAATALTEMHDEREKIHAKPEEGDDLAALEEKFYRLRGRYDDQLEHAGLLAREHRKMALARWSLPSEVTRAVRAAVTHEGPSGVGCFSPAEDAPDPMARMRERLAADVEQHQSTMIQPWKDPEPESEGDLWSVGDGWFYFSVNARAGTARWLLIRHYAQYLRWRDETGTKPQPSHWRPGVAQDTSERGEPVVLARPTPAERTAFYGPEPDLPGALAEIARAHGKAIDGRTELIPGSYAEQRRLEDARLRAEDNAPPIALDAFTNRTGTSLDDLGDRELEQLIARINVERARRTRENGTTW